MRPTTLNASDVAPLSPVHVPDIIISPFAVALSLRVTGTANVTVQHTMDDVFAPGFDPAVATWHNHSTLAAVAANGDSNYAFPVRGIRLVVNSGVGTASLVIVQAGAA